MERVARAGCTARTSQILEQIGTRSTVDVDSVGENLAENRALQETRGQATCKQHHLDECGMQR